MKTTPSEVLTAVSNMLGDNTSGEHSPDEVTCGQCKSWWLHALEVLTDAGPEDEAKVKVLNALLPAKGHPNESCVECEGCRIELSMSMTAVALGVAGVDESVSWGPAHRRGEGHTSDAWESCPSCVKWLAERVEARETLEAFGVDSVRYLGDDSYFLSMSPK